MCILIEKPISKCIIFETNKNIFKETVISAVVYCKSMVKMIVDKGKPMFI